MLKKCDLVRPRNKVIIHSKATKMYITFQHWSGSADAAFSNKIQCGIASCLDCTASCVAVSDDVIN